MLHSVFHRPLWLLYLIVLTAACSERDIPVLPQSNPQLVQALPSATGSTTVQKTVPERTAPGPAPSATAPSPTTTVAPAPLPAPSAPVAGVPLLDAQGQPLPQTEVLPGLDSPTFIERMKRLLQAIEENRPEVAHDAFFPVIAYEQVKDIQKPARDHKFRLMAAFNRNIDEYHRKLKSLARPLTFLGVEASKQPARWMKPGTEGNRLGYYRMLRSQLRYTDGKGTEHRLEITSLISWRGEWYVVHLDGFK